MGHAQKQTRATVMQVSMATAKYQKVLNNDKLFTEISSKKNTMEII